MIGLLLVTGGCGFSLRGSDAISASIPELRLASPQPNSEFMRQLRNGLAAANVQLPDSGANIPLLQLGPERLSSRPVSVNPRARAAQYELRLEVDISLIVQNNGLIPQQTLFTARTLFEDIENISGNREEIELLAGEMRRELVNQILRRLENAQQ